MYDFMFWSGVVAWGLAAFAGILVSLDWMIDWVFTSFWTKREFLAFVYDRLKKKPNPLT